MDAEDAAIVQLQRRAGLSRRNFRTKSIIIYHDMQVWCEFQIAFSTFQVSVTATSRQLNLMITP